MTEVVAALIWQENKFMICQRPSHKARGLLWEFLGVKSEKATKEESQVVQYLLDTLIANKDSCVGMVANIIGVRKRVIVFDNEGTYMTMFNPEIIKKS